MGLTPSYLRYIETCIEQAFGSGNMHGLCMLELGDQVIGGPGIGEQTGKAYFSHRGLNHVSVDINGRHGALARDLTIPEQFHDWHGQWDIVTNSGTTEHVEPFESQYDCFGIIHDCLRVGGIAIHLIPDVDERDVHGAWIDHCRYYYSEKFIEVLSQECGYEMLSNTVINGLRCAAVKKTTHTLFMDDRSKFLNLIVRREYQRHPNSIIGKLSRQLDRAKLLRWISRR